MDTYTCEVHRKSWPREDCYIIKGRQFPYTKSIVLCPDCMDYAIALHTRRYEYRQARKEDMEEYEAPYTTGTDDITFPEDARKEDMEEYEAPYITGTDDITFPED